MPLDLSGAKFHMIPPPLQSRDRETSSRIHLRTSEAAQKVPRPKFEFEILKVGEQKESAGVRAEEIWTSC